VAGHEARFSRTCGAEHGERLEMMLRDLRVYGNLLAERRRAALQAERSGFFGAL